MDLRVDGTRQHAILLAKLDDMSGSQVKPVMKANAGFHRVNQHIDQASNTNQTKVFGRIVVVALPDHPA